MYDQTFATHLLQADCDIRTVQDLLGHAEVATTHESWHAMQVVTSSGAGEKGEHSC
jgi:site-specific recombinase XerC